MKSIKKLLAVVLTLIFCMSTFCLTSFAAVPALKVNVTTVIDNIDDCPTDISTKQFNYTAKRAYSMTRYNSQCYIPVYSGVSFSWKHNSTSTVNFNSYTGATTCNLLIFEPNSSTDSHLSLDYIEYTTADNVKEYIYTDGGSATVNVTAFNWLQIIDNSKGTANVTLHYKYNPDIESAATVINPNPNYSKVIDYLGDGVTNPDTNADGVNDYRIYSSLDTEDALPDAADKDIIFILDVSGSMNDVLSGSSTRLTQMKSTVNQTIDVLTQNSNNRISIITFETSANVRISNSTSKTALKSVVNSLVANGGTNYYSSLLQADQIVKTLTNPDRETVVFFLSDGLPTAGQPAVNATGLADQSSVAYLYAEYAAKSFQTVDRFYSVFIGSDTGAASTLQTVTQFIDTSIEKYMVQATNSEQLNNTFSRFLSQMDNSLYNIVFEDKLSEYVTYAGDVKVTRTTTGASETVLTEGIDYSTSYNSSTKTQTASLLNSALPDSEYIVSFNVKANESAMDYYQLNVAYPHIGDMDTDYTGNETSSGREGFYSNEKGTVKYSFGVGGTEEETYNKPVVQAVLSGAIPVQIESSKILTGKDLEENMFSFQLKGPDGTIIDTVTNDQTGKIVFKDLLFTKPCSVTYEISEVIPTEPEQGITYDRKTITATVTVVRNGDDLNATVNYSHMSFVNDFTPQPVSVQIKVRKELTGRTLEENMFKFSLRSGDDSTFLQTAQNTASGDVIFSQPITFNSAGTYTYLVRETDTSPIPNIVYDSKTITATVTVVENGGILSASVQYSPNATFNNKYKPPVTATIAPKVVLTGMKLTPDMFQFELRKDDSSRELVGTAGNSGNGTIPFNITYTAAGTHYYTVQQVTLDSAMRYTTLDKQILKVTVVVTEDNTTGVLTANAVYPVGGTFYNRYQIKGRIS